MSDIDPYAELEQLREEAVVIEFEGPRGCGKTKWLTLTAASSSRKGASCLFVCSNKSMVDRLEMLLLSDPAYAWRGQNYLVITESGLLRALRAIDWQGSLHVFMDDIDQFADAFRTLEEARYVANRIYLTATTE